MLGWFQGKLFLSYFYWIQSLIACYAHYLTIHFCCGNIRNFMYSQLPTMSLLRHDPSSSFPVVSNSYLFEHPFIFVAFACDRELSYALQTFVTGVICTLIKRNKSTCTTWPRAQVFCLLYKNKYFHPHPHFNFLLLYYLFIPIDFSQFTGNIYSIYIYRKHLFTPINWMMGRSDILYPATPCVCWSYGGSKLIRSCFG